MSNDTFVHQFRVKTQPWQTKKLKIRLNALRDLYNGVLSESMYRLDDIYHDKNYQVLINDYKLVLNEIKKAEKHKSSSELKALKRKKTQISKAFSELDKKYQFSAYDLQPFAKKMKDRSYMKDHLDSDTIQMISDRAFNAVKDYRFGLRGKPRFKSSLKGLRSISGKANRCIRFTQKGQFAWHGLTLDLVYDQKDKYHVQQHALACDIKFVRLLHRNDKGKDVFYIQLVLKGEPLIKSNYQVKKNKIVGLDIGVSTVAAVSQDQSLLTPFVMELDPIQDQIKHLQRKASRKLRLLNSDNYNELGAVKKGSSKWIKSNQYLKLQQEIKLLQEKLKFKRYHLHYSLVKEVLSLGNVLHIEKNNYKAWQKGLYGKTIGFRAPSQFETILIRKASQTGGDVKFIDSRKHKLSQYEHVSHTFIKKTLNDRIHRLHDNTIVQRDLYSAALAYSFDFEKDQVDRNLLKKEWKSLDMSFKYALSTLYVQYTNSQNKGLFPSCLRDKQLLELERIAYESLIETSQCLEPSLGLNPNSMFSERSLDSQSPLMALRR